MLRRLVDFEVVDRGLVLGAQAFSALVPLLVVLPALLPGDGRDFAADVIDRFELRGRAAESVRSAFAAPADAGHAVSVLGIVVLIVSALAFTRALQRTYERAWDLERRGLRGTRWGLTWLAGFIVYWTVFPLVERALSGAVALSVGLAETFLLWLVTPWVLLAGRIPWRRLVPQALLSAAGMTVVGIGLAIYLPRAVSTSAEEFGSIGVAFTLLTSLWAAGLVLATAAALGAPRPRGQGERGAAP